MSSALAAPQPLFQSPPTDLVLRRFTLEEYHQMADAGVLSSTDRVELLDGWIVKKMTQHPPHSFTLMVLWKVFSRYVPSDWHLRSQVPLTLSISEPEPDLAIVSGPLEHYRSRHPIADDIGLLIEVADSTLTHDRKLKGFLYSQAGISEYWIVNLYDRQIEVYTQPNQETNQYQASKVYGPDEVIPLILRGVPIADIPVREILK